MLFFLKNQNSFKKKKMKIYLLYKLNIECYIRLQMNIHLITLKTIRPHGLKKEKD